jgi:transposase
MARGQQGSAPRGPIVLHGHMNPSSPRYRKPSGERVPISASTVSMSPATSVRRFARLNLKSARAWRIKEAASGLWAYSYRGAAERNRKALLGWIARCRLDPMIEVGKMVKNYFWGILNAIMLKVTNAIAESINATIQKIKARACGFRNRARLRIVILFHKGGLPKRLSAWPWRSARSDP